MCDLNESERQAIQSVLRRDEELRARERSRLRCVRVHLRCEFIVHYCRLECSCLGLYSCSALEAEARIATDSDDTDSEKEPQSGTQEDSPLRVLCARCHAVHVPLRRPPPRCATCARAVCADCMRGVDCILCVRRRCVCLLPRRFSPPLSSPIHSNFDSADAARLECSHFWRTGS